MNKFRSTTLSIAAIAACSAPAFAIKAPVPAESPAPAVKTAAPAKLIKGQKTLKSKTLATKKVAKCANVQKTK